MLRANALHASRRLVRLGRRRLRQTLGVDPIHHPDLATYRTLHIGSDYGGWTMLPDFISRDSTIYSVGVGEDVSFDLALIERFGVTVHAFDPTPRSIAWIGAQRLPDQFVFHNFGVADVDGRMMLYPPKRADHVSFSAVARASTASLGAEFQVFKLATIMRMLGHEHLDLLKMDIEGAEYGVIDSILETQVEVRQLLVEFHHRLPGIGARRTDVSVRRLRDAGFGLFHMSDSGEEYSFIRS